MKSLLVIREQIKMIYSKYEFIITPLYKFLIALISLSIINSNLGYFEKIDSTPIVIVASLFCSFMPFNICLFICAAFIMLHIYELSTAAAIVVLLLFVLLFLLYFRFSPKDTIYVEITPITFLWKIPYVSPIACGLLCGPVSAISVSVGIVVFYVLKFIKENELVLSASEEETLVTQFKLVIDGIIKNREMYVWIIAFSVTIILVYLIRRLSINHAWTIAMIAGAITDIVVILMGALLFDMDVSFVGVFFGTILALGIAKIIEFFRFNVDYKRIEYVQYEDDEYYYYVKAVPKNAVAKPEKSVKKVSSATKQIPVIDREMLDSETEKKADEDEDMKIVSRPSQTSVRKDVPVTRTNGTVARTSSRGTVGSRSTMGTRPNSSRTTTARTISHSGDSTKRD